MGITEIDQWEVMNTTRAHDNFKVFKLRELQELREARIQMPLRQRVIEIVGFLTTLQHARVLTVERSSSTADSLHLPSIDEGIGYLDPKDTRRFLSNLSSNDEDVLLSAVVGLENAIDSHKGRLVFEANLTGDEKNDRIIQEFENYTPEEIVKVEPGLGSVQAIKLARESVDRDPITGCLVDLAETTV